MLLLILLGSSAAAAASSALAEFDQANRLYEQGKFAQAIEAYQQLVDKDIVSPAIYFNLGNACFKSGQVGHAIVNYRLAERLAPRDPDIRANLRFARESVDGTRARGAGRLKRWLNLVSIDEATLAASAAVWVCFLLLAAGQIRRDWARTLRPYQQFFGVAAAVAVLWLGLLMHGRFYTSTAVVIAKDAVVRYGPFEEAQSSFDLRSGAELAVLDQKDLWFQVTDTANRTGWLEAKDVFLLPRG